MTRVIRHSAPQERYVTFATSKKLARLYLDEVFHRIHCGPPLLLADYVRAEEALAVVAAADRGRRVRLDTAQAVFKTTST
jgi:hypothetical protein